MPVPDPHSQSLFGLPYAHLKQLTDKDGYIVDVPQTIKLDDATDIAFGILDSDLKSAMGRGYLPKHIGRGKGKIEPSITVNATTARDLGLLLGIEVTAGGKYQHRDASGVTIPNEYSTQMKIRNVATLHLGKWKTNTSVKIATVTATSSSLATLAAGTYAVSGGRYRFSAKDVGKTAELTYTVAGGGGNVTAKTTIKIPKQLTYDVQLWKKAASVQKDGGGYFDVDAYNTNGGGPSAGHVQVASNGVLVFSGSETETAATVKHTTDNVSATTVIATLPAPGYYTIIDPPSSAVYVAVLHVDLVSGTITGLSAGDRLTQAATPATGQFDVDPGGVFTFAADDEGVVVKAFYTTDFEFVRIDPPLNGEFVESLGVRNTNDLQMTQVALTTPIALTLDQYCVGLTGAHYFDNTNRGDKVFIDYLFSTEEGAGMLIYNEPMGSVATFKLVLGGVFEGQRWSIIYNAVGIAKIAPAVSQDDLTKIKIDMICYDPPGDGPVVELSMAA